MEKTRLITERAMNENKLSRFRERGSMLWFLQRTRIINEKKMKELQSGNDRKIGMRVLRNGNDKHVFVKSVCASKVKAKAKAK